MTNLLELFEWCCIFSKIKEVYSHQFKKVRRQNATNPIAWANRAIKPLIYYLNMKQTSSFCKDFFYKKKIHFLT